jgi:sulfoxide reductase heme-binding subunit YedZ
MNDQLLWFASRGSGIVSLLLLTSVAVLGLISMVRWQRPTWPRFLINDLHSNLALLSHVTSAVLDPFTNLGIYAATIPFASSYRPLWVGLGVISIYLFVALIITSLLRERLGERAWRLVHWVAYAAWPLAVLHSMGSGSDAFAPWMMGIEALCIGAVVLALTWRIASGRTNREQLPAVVGASRRVRAPYADRDQR